LARTGAPIRSLDDIACQACGSGSFPSFLLPGESNSCAWPFRSLNGQVQGAEASVALEERRSSLAPGLVAMRARMEPDKTGDRFAPHLARPPKQTIAALAPGAGRRARGWG